MFDDAFLSQSMVDYIAKTSSPEPELLRALREETAATTNAPQMLSGSVVGQLLYFLARISKAKRILEIGTFTGYSALYMAQALPEDGSLITCEIDSRHAKIAQNYFDKSPHGSKIDLLLAPALESIQKLQGPFDLIFIDADKKAYPDYYEHAIRMLCDGGIAVLDNALWNGLVLEPKDAETKRIAEVNQKAAKDPRVESLLLAIRDGVLLVRKV